jgi:tRNA nucleotidyltransferase/poly(A) polymerase
MRSFKNFLDKYKINENIDSNNDWKKEFIKIEKGFIPPSNLRPIIQAFLDSNEIVLMQDTSKEIKMPRKNLYLCGGSVRDFLRNKTQKNYKLTTNATPEQIVLILENANFGNDHKDKKYYYSKDQKIIAVVNNDEFEIDNFKKKINGRHEYTDDILEDCKRRDLTINSLYIELSRTDGENNKLYDPSKKGWYDITHGIINFVEDSEKHMESNPISMLRAIRFYSQHGEVKIDQEIKDLTKEHKNKLNNIPYEEIKKEFMKGLLSKDIDPIKYINNYKIFNVLDIIFPNMKFNLLFPKNFESSDKLIFLSWILKGNSTTEIFHALSKWSYYERRFIIFMQKLKYCKPNSYEKFIELRKISGVSDEQIKKWGNLFKYTNLEMHKRIINFYKFLKK